MILTKRGREKVDGVPSRSNVGGIATTTMDQMRTKRRSVERGSGAVVDLEMQTTT